MKKQTSSCHRIETALGSLSSSLDGGNCPATPQPALLVQFFKTVGILKWTCIQAPFRDLI
jgi:hypothetical protein